MIFNYADRRLSPCEWKQLHRYIQSFTRKDAHRAISWFDNNHRDANPNNLLTGLAASYIYLGWGKYYPIFWQY